MKEKRKCTLVVDEENVEECSGGRGRRVSVRDDGHGREHDLEGGQVLEAAVDVPEELDLAGLGGLEVGAVDFRAQQIQDQGQGPGGVRLEPENVRGTQKLVFPAQMVH